MEAEAPKLYFEGAAMELLIHPYLRMIHFYCTNKVDRKLCTRSVNFNYFRTNSDKIINKYLNYLLTLFAILRCGAISILISKDEHQYLKVKKSFFIFLQ